MASDIRPTAMSVANEVPGMPTTGPSEGLARTVAWYREHVDTLRG